MSQSMSRAARPNCSLERTPAGRAGWSRIGQSYHPLRSQSALPAGYAQLKRLSIQATLTKAGEKYRFLPLLAVHFSDYERATRYLGPSPAVDCSKCVS